MLKLTPKIEDSVSILIFHQGEIIILFDWDQKTKAKPSTMKPKWDHIEHFWSNRKLTVERVEGIPQ